MQKAFVLNHNQEPLMPCHPARARELLEQQKAAVFRLRPFTIILRQPANNNKQPVELKFDPGSKTTGIALTSLFRDGHNVLWGAELYHKGDLIKDALAHRSALRRSRREKNRSREIKADNRKHPKNWIAPSIMSRIDNINNWTSKLKKFAPITHIISENEPLTKECCITNTMRKGVNNRLKSHKLPVSYADANKTKSNRINQGYPKASWIDAVCVGDSGSDVFIHKDLKPLSIKAIGRGHRKLSHNNEHNTTHNRTNSKKVVNGFMSGDLVRAVVPKGKHRGTHIGRLHTVRNSGKFDISTKNGICYGVSCRHCTLLQRSDGYDYN